MRSLFATALLAILISPSWAADPITFYVSSAGNDAASGKNRQPDAMNGPFATLDRARDAVRTARKENPKAAIVVRVLAGTYVLDHSFQLSAEDSGSPEAPITYEAEPGQEVHLAAGREVSNFRPVTDQSILDRLAPGARGQVWQADLKELGITNFGQLKSRGFGRPMTPAGLELFFQDKPMTLARWPNEGFVKIASIPKDQAGGDEHGGTLGKLTAGFYYDGDRPRTWKNQEDLWVHGYWAWDWANSYERIESIDTANRLIKTASPHGLYGFRAGQRIFFLNIFEELDSPGEWYLDRKTGVLYFWPPAPMGQGKALVSILEQPMIAIKDASHITVRGFILEAARGLGIQITGGSSNLVDDCTLRNLGNYAAVVRGGTHHTVSNCQIYYTGDGGIDLSGGDRKTLTAANHLAYNNHIHHVARWSKCYVPAIHMNGVGIHASNNLIHDHPHCAILFGGNEHVVERNEIHHVALETGDVGAIYTGRDYTYRGNVIRQNYIHHTGGVGMGSMGVYMDDCVSGTQIVGNVFHKVQRAVFLGGGRDFRVENNIFIDCNHAVELDGRGLDKSPVWHNMVTDYMKKHMEAMNYNQPPYSTRYPEIATIEKYYQSDNGVPPENVLVARNICVGKWLNIYWHATPKAVTLKDNLVDADPHFVDLPNGDFRLKNDSPAFKLGFERIPMELIGLQKDRDNAEASRR